MRSATSASSGPRSATRHSHLERGEQAVAGGGVVQENDVAGLLAAQIRAAAQHLLEHVAVAHGHAHERKTLARQHTLQAEIGHGGADDSAAL